MQDSKKIVLKYTYLSIQFSQELFQVPAAIYKDVWKSACQSGYHIYLWCCALASIIFLILFYFWYLLECIILIRESKAPVPVASLASAPSLCGLCPVPPAPRALLLHYLGETACFLCSPLLDCVLYLFS